MRYRHDLSIALLADKTARKFAEEMKESTRPEDQSRKERLISQGLIDEAFGGAPESPQMIALRTWRRELVETWSDEP